MATIETDKINAEVEASADGVLRRIVAQEGAVVPVVGLLAVIGAPDEPDAAIDAVVGGGPAAGAKAPGRRGPGARRQRQPRPRRRHLPRWRRRPRLGRPARPRPRGAPVPATRGAGLARSPAGWPPSSRSTWGRCRGAGPGGGSWRRTCAPPRRRPPPRRATAPPAAPGGENGFVRASPLARRLAREQGLDLLRLTRDGPRGADRGAGRARRRGGAGRSAAAPAAARRRAPGRGLRPDPAGDGAPGRHPAGGGRPHVGEPAADGAADPDHGGGRHRPGRPAGAPRPGGEGLRPPPPHLHRPAGVPRRPRPAPPPPAQQQPGRRGRGAGDRRLAGDQPGGRRGPGAGAGGAGASRGPTRSPCRPSPRSWPAPPSGPAPGAWRWPTWRGAPSPSPTWGRWRWSTSPRSSPQTTGSASSRLSSLAEAPISADQICWRALELALRWYMAWVSLPPD